MKFGGSDTDVEFGEDETPSDKLRRIEHQFGWKGEDWHFNLTGEIEPHKVYAFFRHAKLIGQRLYFDGRKDSPGNQAFYWVQTHLKAQVYKVLGDLEVCLADNGKIEKSFHIGRLPDGYIGKNNPKIVELFQQALRSARA